MGHFVLSDTHYVANLRTPWHEHETPAFCLVLSGSYVQRFRNRRIEYGTARVLFRPPHEPHTDHISSIGARCFIVEPGAQWLSMVGLSALMRPHALTHTSARARWLIEHARREFRTVDATASLALEGLMLALGAEFARLPHPDIRHRRPAWLDEVRARLDTEFERRLTLAALAAETGVHAVHLAAAFRKAFGRSVHEYVRERRMEAARAALADCSRSINEIALTLGFASQSHFTRVFRENTGLTPFAYRRLGGKASVS